MEKTSANSLPKPGVPRAPCCPIFSRISATRGPTSQSGGERRIERVQVGESDVRLFKRDTAEVIGKTYRRLAAIDVTEE